MEHINKYPGKSQGNARTAERILGQSREEVVLNLFIISCLFAFLVQRKFFVVRKFRPSFLVASSAGRHGKELHEKLLAKFFPNFPTLLRNMADLMSESGVAWLAYSACGLFLVWPHMLSSLRPSLLWMSVAEDASEESAATTCSRTIGQCCQYF